jgi:hypothetical protein
MTAQITQAEINELKKQFDDKIGNNYSVVFDKDEEGRDNFKIYKGQSGEDALWSGSVILEQDYYIKWEFSLKNGPKVTKATFKINDSNKDIISTIFDLYNIWSDNLSKYVRSSEENNNSEEITSTDAELDVTAGQETIAESRSFSGRKRLIDSSGDRMKKLAGL